MLYVNIDTDSPTGFGGRVVVNLNDMGAAPADAEMVSLAEAILASDAVQNSSAVAGGAASLTSVVVDSQRTLYPIV